MLNRLVGASEMESSASSGWPGTEFPRKGVPSMRRSASFLFTALLGTRS